MMSRTTPLLIAVSAVSTCTAFVTQPISVRLSSSLNMSDKQEIEVVSQPDKDFLDKKG